ncbi:MAG: transketolase [Catenisphaera adipataccumulans]|uniref:transketolase n=1 Tax=Catenisphaera adipataccumulans TaxID=700500 RepID=UPI003D908F85
MEQETNKQLHVLAAKIRRDILAMLLHRGYGHLGGSLSLVEYMSVLYGKQLHYDPKDPQKEDRDRVVLSKGHAGPVWYSALAESGFFDRDMLYTLNDGGTILPSHPDRLKTPGVDMTTGSLGQGTSSAAGIAMGLKMRCSDRYTYLIVGDGELNEGQCWEAFQFIANYKLDHCIVAIDDNKRQLDGYTKDIMYPFSYADKMKAFGFNVIVVKGDDMEAIDAAIDQAKATVGQPTCLVLDTVKGQGVPYFEEMRSNHSVKFNNDANINAAKEAIAQLDAYIAKEESK